MAFPKVRPPPHTLVSVLWLPESRERVFSFFADAFNLEAITPPWLRFTVLTPGPITMGPGTMIDYRLKLRGIPLRWRSEITAWHPPWRFLDEQRVGPYRRWSHTHTFDEFSGGTLCGDVVHYAAPGGRLINALFVRRELERIFAYRRDAIRRLFLAAASPRRAQSLPV